MKEDKDYFNYFSFATNQENTKGQCNTLCALQ